MPVHYGIFKALKVRVVIARGYIYCFESGIHLIYGIIDPDDPTGVESRWP